MAVDLEITSAQRPVAAAAGPGLAPAAGLAGAAVEEQLIDGGKVMPVWDHLRELRDRLIRALIGVAIFFALGFAFAERILAELQIPLLAALPEGRRSLHFTGPLDIFLADLKVGAIVGVIGSAPVWLYQFWRFFEPALYPRERRYILPFVCVSSVLFLGGMAFCYFFVLPATLRFLIGMGLEAGTPVITVKDYLSLVLSLIFAFGAVFQTPVLLVLLALLDLVTAEGLAKARRVVVVLILFVAAVLTPPDPISQVALAVPVYLMYEAAIVLIRMIKRDPAAGGSAHA